MCVRHCSWSGDGYRGFRAANTVREMRSFARAFFDSEGFDTALSKTKALSHFERIIENLGNSTKESLLPITR